MAYNTIEYVDHGDFYIPHVSHQHPKEYIKQVSDELAALVSDAIEAGYIPVILGGDHSVAIGSIAGASKAADRLGVLWFDFHTDSNTPETSPSGNIHGMPVAISLGYGYPELINCGGFRPKINPDDIVIIGAHDIDPPEIDFLEGLGVRGYTLFDIENQGISRIFNASIGALEHCDSIHVSFDIDVLNPDIAPGTGIFSKEGLSYREA